MGDARSPITPTASYYPTIPLSAQGRAAAGLPSLARRFPYPCWMLPEGFQWRPYLAGPGLYYGTRLIACASPVANGWRLMLSGGGRPVRYEFLPNLPACRRYAEAWATKWQDEIRKAGGAPNTVP